MIRFYCTQCGKRLEIKDEHAGKEVKCPDCGAVAIVPQKTSDGDEAAEQIYGERASLDDLAAAVQGTGRHRAQAQQARRTYSLGKGPKGLRCPHCGKRGISFLRKMFLGPISATCKCKACGKKVGLPLTAWLFFLPLDYLEACIILSILMESNYLSGPFPCCLNHAVSFTYLPLLFRIVFFVILIAFEAVERFYGSPLEPR